MQSLIFCTRTAAGVCMRCGETRINIAVVTSIAIVSWVFFTRSSDINMEDDGLWHVERIEANGDCLFIALAVAEAHARSRVIIPYGSKSRESLAYSLRLAANDILCPEGSPAQKPLPGQNIPPALLIETMNEETPDTYCKRLRVKGQWGSAAEIAALSVVLNRTIEVYSPGSSGEIPGVLIQRFELHKDKCGCTSVSTPVKKEHAWPRQQKSIDISCSHREPLTILYSESAHYSALLRLQPSQKDALPKSCL